MAMYLHLLATESVNNYVSVKWMNGTTNHGLLTLDMNKFNLGEKEQMVAAELLAIRYLVVEGNVLKREGLNIGQGIEVITTRGAVKKAWIGKGQDIYRPYIFFKQRLPLLTVSTARAFSTHPVEGAPRTDIYEPEILTYEMFDTHIGRLAVTYHSIERFAERLAEVEPFAKRHPLSMLMNRLNNEQLVPVKLNNKVLSHKTRKYGPNDDAVHWAIPNSRFHFVTAPHESGEYKILLTVYARAMNT